MLLTADDVSYNRLSRLLHGLLLVIVAIAPLVTMVVMTRLWLNTTPDDYVPNTWNDQVGYWRYIGTFASAGFQGGYYALDEKLAPLGALTYDVHGPMFPMIYGTLARFTGWGYNTGLWFNVLFLGAGSLAFALLARLRGWQIIALIALTTTFWIIPFYALYTSQESLHQTFALVLAGLFYRLFEARRLQQTPQRWVSAAAVGLLVIASLTRMSWAILYLPLLLLIVYPRRWWMALLVVAAGIAMMGVSYGAYVLLASPGASSVTTLMQQGTITTFLLLMQNNLSLWLSYFRFPLLEQPQIVQYLTLLILFIIMLALQWWRRNDDKTDKGLIATSLFHLYNLGVMLGLALVLYLPPGFVRLLGVHMLLTIALMLAQRQLPLVVVLIAINLLALPNMQATFQEYHQQDMTILSSSVDTWRDEVAQYIVYNADTDNRWCNSVLMNLSLYDYHVIPFPPEIGVSWFYESKLVGTVRSQYIYDGERPNVPNRIEPIAELSFGGTLYRNLDADCP